MEAKDEQALIENACTGNRAALDDLSAAAQPRVRAYLLRVTLDYTLADDLTQETLLEMVKSIEALREPTVFWPWLYRIAMSKFQTHLRREHTRRASEQAFEDDFTTHLAAEQGTEGLARLLKTELSRNILAAIEQLDPRERAVLSLRCFNEMPYPDIASAMETTESNARVQFYRAKQALKKQLMRQGLKGGTLLMALGFFGSLTDSASAATAAGTSTAAVSVSAAAVKVPLATAVTAALGTKAACAVAAALVVTTGLLTTTGVVANFTRRSAPPPRQDVRTVHFVAQSSQNAPGATSSLSKGAYEQWYYFPDGVDGPVFYRMQRWDPQMQHRLCAWLQDGQANRYWHSGENTVYLTNHRLWSRSLENIRIRRLPTDTPEMTAFLDRAETLEPGLQIQRDKRTGMTTRTVDRRFADCAGFTCDYEYNKTDTDMFVNPWPDSKVVDERDIMRQRGWGCFSVSGVLNGRIFSGRGRIPYFYDYAAEFSPWLVLNLPDGTTLIDTAQAAVIRDPAGQERVRYPGGRFFIGLLRPWMGMHTIDCVRRDAAHARVEFTTTQDANYSLTGSCEDYFADAHVDCKTTVDGRPAAIHYLIKMEDDLIKSIDILTEDADGRPRQARLEFTFHQSLPDTTAFDPPVIDPAQTPPTPNNGIFWLIDLASENLL